MVRKAAGRLSRLCGLVSAALAISPAVAPAAASPVQVGVGSSSRLRCGLEAPFWTPLHLLSSVPPGISAVTVDGWFGLNPGVSFGRDDTFYLRDDRGLGGRIALVPARELDNDFRADARTLMGRHMEFTGCLARQTVGGERAGVLEFFAYAVIPQRKRDRTPREVELEALRDGAFEGQRILVRGALAGRRHTALRLSTRLSDSDWVLAAEGAAAWMRGKPPEGEGFSLDPDDDADHGRGLAVTGLVSWWRGAPVLLVESVRMTGSRARSLVAILFTLPPDRRLDVDEQRIEVRFSAPMDEGSFEGRVELVDGSGSPVPARRVYEDEWWSLLVTPEAPVAAGSELELRLRSGIVSAEGDGVAPDSEAGEGLLLVQRYRVR